MNSDSTYNVIIIGGGLAGLSAAILLSRKKYKVLVLEKESYPKHKVCGEYVSMESKPFLEMLGVPVGEMNLPVINKLQVTDVKGHELNTPLPQGGFGISRYKLDKMLAGLAEQAGATLLTNTKADSVQWEQDAFIVKAKGEIFTAKIVCGAWGKRSNIDVKWQRSFLKEQNNALSNYVAVKYHISSPWPNDVVGLHNFTNGYCGISQVEDGRCCTCYLTTAASLHKSGNDLKKFELAVVMKNPVLNKIFSNAEFLFGAPVTISQISFQKKEHVHEHVLLLGDAAGMITPLCGNGMSMAMHSAKIASVFIDSFLQEAITRSQMERNYITAWKHNFSKRTTIGRIVQNNFGKGITTSIFLKAVNYLPFLKNALIKGTSGKPF
ncbi:MAG: NAD(P)/FAD-dependent oxidoreductase [Chitinophagales bacterium]